VNWINIKYPLIRIARTAVSERWRYGYICWCSPTLANTSSTAFQIPTVFTDAVSIVSFLLIQNTPIVQLSFWKRCPISVFLNRCLIMPRLKPYQLALLGSFRCRIN